LRQPRRAARQLLTRSYGVRRRADVLALEGQARPAISEYADFHDREDFYVLGHTKVFAIMKFSLLG
jgi:hypothetical protein